jgi:hypothetical protein
MSNSDQDNQAVLWATHTAPQLEHWSEGVQAIVNAKVQDPSKVADEVDVLLPLAGIGICQKESRQPTFDNESGHIHVIFAVRTHIKSLQLVVDVTTMT